MNLVVYTFFSVLIALTSHEKEAVQIERNPLIPDQRSTICIDRQSLEENQGIDRLTELCELFDVKQATQVTPLLLSPATVTISATKTDMLVLPDTGPAGASAGDIIEYTIMITNSGDMDATSTQFTDNLDPNTTLVAGSLQCSPIGIGESYNVFGNVGISVPAASGLLINDLNPCSTGSLSVTGVNTTGTQGDVTFAANGGFTFNPASGFNGTTTFEYTVSNGTFTNTATVTLTVAGRIWFIDNNSSNGDGRLGTPYSSIANFNTGATGGFINDIIFLYRQTATNYTGGGLTLKNNQYLIGQGASSGIVALTGITLPPHSLALPATGGTNPVIAHNATAVTLASNNKLHGFNVSNSGGTGIFGSSVGNLRIRDLSVANSNGTALNIASGVLDVIIKKLDASNATTGFRINTTTGSFLVEGMGTMDGSGGLVQAITERGADIQSATNITLKNMDFTNANTANATGTCDNTNDNLSCHAAIYLRNITTIVLDNLNVFNTEEQGLNGNNIGGMTLTNSRFSNCGDEQFEGALKIRELHGTCSIDNCEFDDAANENIEIFNITTPNALNLLVTNSVFRDNFLNTSGEKGIFFKNENAVTNTINIVDCDFLSIKTQGIYIEPGAGTMNVNITDCTFDKEDKKLMAGAHVIPTGSANVNVNILRNTLNVAGGTGLMVSGNGNSMYQARINGNTIVGPANCSDCLDGGSMESLTCNCGGDGITVWATNNCSGKAEVVGNNISGLDYNAFGIYASSRNEADLTLLIDNNDIELSNDAAYGINFQAGNADAGHMATICANVINNTVTFLASGGTPMGPTRRLLNIRSTNTGAVTNIQGTGATLADIWGGVGGNGNMPPSTASPNIVGSSVGAGGVINLNQSCPMTLTHPTALTAPQNELAVVPNQTGLVPTPATSEGTVAETTSGEENSTQALPMMDMVSVGPFTLPATKSITIKFRAMVNDPFPQGVCQVSNQGTVSGGNFSNVLTDDSEAVGPANPTVTPIFAAPTITDCQDNITTGTDPGLCTASESFSATAVGCPTPTLTYRIGADVITSPYVFPIGMTTVNVTASNGVSPDATCSFTVTVTDTQAPDITCLNGTQMRGTNLGNCTYTVSGSEFNPTVNENCPGFTLTNNLNNTNTLAGEVLPTGTTVVTWTITDGATLTDMCTVTIQVTDDDAPTITCPMSILVDCPGDVPAPYANLTAFTNAGGTVNDNCGINDASFALINSAGNSQMFTRTYEITDINGLTATCAQTVTVSDGTPPVITPGTIDDCYPTVEEAETAAIAATMAMDNCPGAVTVTASTMSMADCAVTITVTAKDVANNMSMTTYTTRIDGTAPIVTQGMIEVCYETLSEAETAALAATSATDNCSGPLTETILIVGTCEAVITVTTTDGCGNSTPVTYMTSIDNEDPTVTTGTIEACYLTEEAAETAAIAATTAMDDCPSTIIKTASTAGDCSAIVTVTATDACGNSVSTTYNTRIDGEMPTAIPTSILSCYPTAAAAEAAAKLATTWSDNCSSAAYLETQETASTSGTCAATITVSTMDECGNMRSTTYSTRIDNTMPTAIPTSILSCYPTAAAAEAAAKLATTWSDNCSSAAYLESQETVSTSGTCTATITVSTMDECGNMRSTTYSTRIDNTMPTAIPTSILSCYPTAAAAEAAAKLATTWSDNCSSAAYLESQETASTSGTCTATITVSTMDECGNQKSVTYNTRIDGTMPTGIPTSIAACYPTAAAAEAAAKDATTWSDNCSSLAYLESQETASTSGTCTATITVSTVDECGNSKSVTYSTRIDNAGPTVTPGTIAACYPTEAAAEAAAIDATTANDDCPSSVIKTATTMGDCAAVITVTATDGCGNMASTTYNTRIDNTMPTGIPTSIASCYQTAAAAEAAAKLATTWSDNCSSAAYLETQETASTSGTCSATVTVSTMDECGNQKSVTYSTRIDGTMPTGIPTSIAPCYPNVAAAEAAAKAATTWSDNCSSAAYLETQETASTNGTCSATVTVSTVDECGNPKSVTYNTRIDNTPPTVTPGTIAPCYLTAAAAEAAAIAATTATDNCPGTVTKTATTMGLCSATVTVTATDFCGLSTTTTYTTNIDNTPPTVVCKNSTVFVNSQGAYTLLPSDVFNAGASSDNCPGSLTVVSITPATVTCAQKNTTIPVTVVVADACNNQSTCISMITVDEDISLPPGWDNSDVSTANGSAIFSPCTGENGSFVLTSTGFSTSSSDKLHIAYKEICGNTTVTARVTNMSGGGWGGVMIRETLMPGSKKVALKTQLTPNIRREIRTTTNGPTSISVLTRPSHTWLRLERLGSTLSGYTSPNGVDWLFAFNATISMNGCVFVGIFSESTNNATTTTATLDNVTVTGTPNTLAGRPSGHVNSESGDHVQIFPNPTTGEVSINLDVHAGKPGTIQVFNALGSLVTQERLVPGNLETHNMRIAGSAGVYTVVIQLDDRRIVRRVVVDPNGGR